MTQRVGTEVLNSDVVKSICRHSGGVLRDLIALARDAGEVAYIEGEEQILDQHVNAAAKQLGEAYLRGLGPHPDWNIAAVDEESVPLM